MPQYLVAIQHPDGYDGSLEGEAMMRDIHALNQQMIAAGVRIFAGGLSPARNAKSLRAQPDGDVLTTDGPYLEAKEHIGGFWLLECADMDEAQAWGRKAAIACRAPVEVRAFFEMPQDRATERHGATNLHGQVNLPSGGGNRPLRAKGNPCPNSPTLRRKQC